MRSPTQFLPRPGVKGSGGSCSLDRSGRAGFMLSSSSIKPAPDTGGARRRAPPRSQAMRRMGFNMVDHGAWLDSIRHPPQSLSTAEKRGRAIQPSIDQDDHCYLKGRMQPHNNGRSDHAVHGLDLASCPCHLSPGHQPDLACCGTERDPRRDLHPSADSDRHRKCTDTRRSGQGQDLIQWIRMGHSPAGAAPKSPKGRIKQHASQPRLHCYNDSN